MKKKLKFKKIKSKRKWIFLLILSTVIYFTWRVCFTIPVKTGGFSFIFGTILLLAELAGLYDLLLHFWNVSRLVVPVKPTLSEDTVFPEVDVFIATYNEPVSLIHKTLIGCLNMAYPDPNAVHIYVLDDGNRSEMAELCRRLNVGYITRSENTHAKAGNINNALKQTHSPYVVTFDADMIPRSQFLMETIPYFIENQQLREEGLKQGANLSSIPKPLGFLQVPQAFYNADCFQYRLFTENAVPNEQNYFHQDVQLGKNSSNSVIYSGSNTVINRAALDEIGGFVTGIITEDIATGIKIQGAGYQCYALDTIQATGLSPYDLNGLVKQRQRWARGCIQTFRQNNPLFAKNLTLIQRLNYFDALIYWFSSFKRFIFLFAPILFSVFGVIVVDAPLKQVLICWLPFYFISTRAFHFFSGNTRTAHWTNIYETILMPPLAKAIFLESIGIKKRKFEVTSKTLDLDHEKRMQLKLAMPHLILLTLTLIGIYRSLVALTTPEWQSYIVILFWLVHNGIPLALALYFTWGRPIYREHERIKVKGTATLSLQHQTHTFDVYDLSEQGISIVSDFPHFIELEHEHCLTVSIEGRHFTLPSTFLRVDPHLNHAHKFIFRFNELSESDYQNLILTLYDREPQFPRHIQLHSPLKTLWRNTKHRMKKNKTFARKTTRLPYQLNGGTYHENLKHLTLKDFNYTHVVLKGEKTPQQLNLTLKTNPRYQLRFHYKKLIKNKLHLYELKSELSPDLIQAIQAELKALSDFVQPKNRV